MTVVVLVMVLALASLVVLYLFFGSKGNNVGDRLAAIDASAGIGQANEASLFKRLMDDKQRNKMARMLQEAGWYDVTPHKMLMRSVTGLVAGSIFGALLIVGLHQHGVLGYLGLAVGMAGGAYYPRTKLNGAIVLRKTSVHRELPDFLDMLSTTVQAGVGLNGALATAVDGLEGALGDELRAALQDIRLGRSRADALVAMANRVHEQDLSTTVTAIVQSEQVGASITTVLEQLAAEARERRFLRAEEIAGTLPTKLIFPMALCMLPALFVIIFGSVAASFMAHK
ncbi:MAG: type II secretion system F family protein [Candidatus Eremiobacteraeota bacterium]|nr:type II secretion system F family protein [Candidatus Eremiobacteraeota bacterium]